MPVLPFAHLALYRFCNLTLFQVFLENSFLIMAFCTILCQSYILVPFLNGFYTPIYVSVLSSHVVSDQHSCGSCRVYIKYQVLRVQSTWRLVPFICHTARMPVSRSDYGQAFLTSRNPTNQFKPKISSF